MGTAGIYGTQLLDRLDEIEAEMSLFASKLLVLSKEKGALLKEIEETAATTTIPGRSLIGPKTAKVLIELAVKARKDIEKLNKSLQKKPKKMQNAIVTLWDLSG